MKRQGKPGIVRDFSILCNQVREKSGKPNYLVSISFSFTFCMVACEVITYSLSVNVNFNTLRCEVASVRALTNC